MKLQTLIPASPRDVSCVEHSSDSPEPSHARRILVADDDAGTRCLISTVLARAGFDVNAAADGQQAWESLHHEHFDLLVTDNEMPRLTGMKLIEQIRKEGMSLPVVVASGSFAADRARNDPQLQIAAVLLKPFDLLELLDTVRHALQSAGEAAAGHGPFHQLHSNREPTPNAIN